MAKRKTVKNCVPNRHVRFRINDIYLPEPAQVLAQLHGDDLLHGRVIELSDSGAAKNFFAVVKVEGLSQPLVVPISKIIDYEPNR